MNQFYRLLKLLIVSFLLLQFNTTLAQSGVLNPNDTIAVYNPSAPPATPSFGTMVKWVKTNRLSWNTSSFKSYYYKGIQFRLKFPKTYQHGVNDGKKYPVFVFFHGIGEAGSIYDNEYQLYHGGQNHMNAVDNGVFDGFLLYPQSVGGTWTNQFGIINEIIQNYLVPQVKADPWRIYVDGLSGGGAGSWRMMINYPKTVAACLPISNSTGAYTSGIEDFKYTPIWEFQGGLDTDPSLSSATSTANTILAAGSDFKMTVYPDQGHGCWYSAWAEPDFYPFMLRAYKSNPWVLYGRTDFCPGDTINLTAGVTPGFTSYQWRKDGVIIPGATGNSINVTSVGSYDCQINDNGNLSEWSRIPLVIKYKTTTITPDITLTANSSKVLPTIDGSDGVKLQLPDGYSSYEWRKGDTTSAVIGTTRFLTATTPGNYYARVTEQYGCSSNFSNVFNVIDGTAANGPDAPTSLTGQALGITSVKLNWNQNASPAYNETGFEIYQATATAGPYTLINVTGADASSYTVNNLNSFTNYYFKLRAINNNAASQITAPVNIKTLKDTIAPTSPSNLTITLFTRSQVDLSWGASSDDIGVVAYDVYINGAKAYTTTNTTISAYALPADSTFNFVVKARDFQGNTSMPSNQATATTYSKGLNYKFYTGEWSVLPDFTTLTPLATGVINNVGTSVSTVSTEYALLFQGYIKLPASGAYTFRLNSDDGSKLFLNTPYSYSGTPTINNDGLHAGQDVDGTVTLAAGVYPITVAFFQLGGGANVNLSWKVPGSGSFVAVPDSVFTDGFTPAGTAPAAPSGLTATATAYNKIKLQWNDNSNNETGFELYRSSSSTGNFAKVALTAANATSYTDSALNASSTYYYKIRAVGKYGESNYDQGIAAPLTYAYYEGSWSTLPDFSTLTPKKTGIINNFNIGVADQQDNFAFKFNGTLKVPADGAYTFYTASDDGSKLYIDGVQVVNNDGLHGTSEQSGVITLTQGYHNIIVTFFELGGDQVLNVSWQGPGFSKQAIPDAALASVPVTATTLALPGAAAIPTNLVANTESSSSLALSWANSDASVTKFELYRSTPDNSYYTLAATIAGSKTTFSDSSLASNTNYYYKLRAYNVGGYSGFSNETSKTTLDNIPVVTDIPAKNQRYGTSWSTAVTATDADNEPLTISFVGLPAFAYFTGTGNGTGTLTSNPQQSDTGTYNIKIIATDTHGGADTSSFNLTVNNSQPIVLGSISGITVQEGGKGTVSITGNYKSTDSVTVVAANLPSFATLVNNGNNSFAIVLNPVVGQKGTYSNVTVTATNAYGESSSQSFTVTVIEKITTNININFNPSSGSQPGTPWNSTGGKITAGSFISNLKDTLGNSTGVNMTFTDAWDGTATSGAVTNTNTGVYPDAIMKTLYYSTATITKRITFSGLSASNKYDFVFFSSRSGNAPTGDNRITQFTIGAQTVSMSASPSNTTRTVQITGVSPNASGVIEVGVLKDAGALQSNLNVMVVKASASDGATVATPAGLAVAAAGQTKLNLTWTAVTGNPTGVQVWRSSSANGAFTKVATVAGSAVAYTDSLLSAATTYYYKLRAASDTLVSPFTVAASATTLANVSAAPPATITATGTAADKIRLNWTAGTGTETGYEIWRSSTANGTYSKVITVAGNVLTYTDQGLSTLTTYYYKMRSLVDTVTSSYSAVVSGTTLNSNIPSIYVNFSTVTSAIAPWNNTNAAIAAGSTFSNLSDSIGTSTGINLALVQGWVGTATSGAVTNTNTGVYPDAVMKTFYYDTVSTAKNVLVTGLSSSRKYDFTFFASRSGNATSGDNRITYYSIGSQTVSLAASPSNTSKTVQIRGISPDANGQIQINIQKDAGAVWAQINALVITPRLYDGTPYAPETLTANGLAKDKIRLDWTLSTIDQTGIEVWRSNTENGSYSLVTTLSGTATTYTNTGLSTGTVYFYKLRAVKNGAYSPYTSAAGASTYLYNVNINFNDGSTTTPAEPGAWNNTNALISNGFALSNLITDEYINTGLTMTVINNFSGYNTLGAVTGNNSGLYSDNVIKGFYYVNYKDTARIQISGLNQSMLYTFSFFGSTTYQNGTTSTYTIGNQTATLDSWQNTTNTTLLRNIQPDANGNVLITIASSQGYGYLNELSIMGAPSPYPVTLRRVTRNTPAVAIASTDKDVKEMDNTTAEIAAYPNPFVDDILLKLNLKQDVSKLSVILTDLTGQPVRLQSFSNLKKGLWQQKLGLNGNTLSSGVYFVRVSGIPGEKDRVIKVVK